MKKITMSIFVTFILACSHSIVYGEGELGSTWRSPSEDFNYLKNPSPFTDDNNHIPKKCDKNSSDYPVFPKKCDKRPPNKCDTPVSTISESPCHK